MILPAIGIAAGVAATRLSSQPASHASRVQRVVFGKAGWAIDLADCEEIVHSLPSIFKGWGIKTGSPRDFLDVPLRAVIRRASADQWRWIRKGAPKPRDWDRIPPRSAMRVMTDIHDAVLHWHLADRPELLCLHGGAIRIGEGLLCFPARGFTGKSTLIAHLAALGHTVYADDVLGLTPRSRGLALGFMPRLRTPLPDGISPSIGKYIAVHTAAAAHGWLYLRPDETGIAGFGETAPIKGFIMLERRPDGPAELSSIGLAHVLQRTIAENIIRKLPMAEIFDRLHRLVARCSHHQLTFSDPLEAARLLARHFA
jgi:hypothetical protein